MDMQVQFSAEDIAVVCYETNRAYCVELGDFSQTSWDDAPDWQKLTVLDGVYFHLKHPDASDSASHENWLKEKMRTGWVWGSVKDEEKKTHPCMVPFKALPKEQQAKDALFRSVVSSLRTLL